MESKTMKIAAVAVVALVVIAALAFMLRSEDSSGDSITIAYGNANGWDAIIYADETGMFEAEGVNVTSNLCADGGLAMTSVMSGQADMTFVGIDPIINMSMNEGARGIKVIGGMMLPFQSSMYLAYDDTKITTTKKVTTSGGDTTMINVFDDIVASDGTKTGKKIAVPLATAFKSYYIGYLQLLRNGGDSYGNTYPAGQITEAQYNALVNTSDSSIYINSTLATISSALTSGQAAVIIGTNSILSTAVDADPTKFHSYCAPGTVASGFCITVVSEKALQENRNAVIKVLRAMDKAGVLMTNDSTEYDVALKTAWRIYNTVATESNIETYVNRQLTYYNDIRLDVCTVKDMDVHLKNTATILGYPTYDVSKIWDPVLEDEIIKAVHNGGKYQIDVAAPTTFISWTV